MMLKIYRSLERFQEKDLCISSPFLFSEDTLGITRFYEALRADQQIERVVKIYRDDRISINQIAVMEDDTQYQIRMVQAAKDDDGIDIQKLSLERVSDPYEIAG